MAVEATDDTGVIVYDDELVISGISPHAPAALGMPDGYLGVGDSYAKCIRFLTENDPGVGGDTIDAAVESRIAEARALRPMRTDFVREDAVIVEIVGQPVSGVGYVTTYTDVTARRRAEAAFAESQERFMDFAELGSDWFWEMGPDLRFTYLSPRFFEITGLDPEERLGKTRLQHVSFQMTSVDWHAHMQDLESRQPFRNFEYDFIGWDGRTVYVRISGIPVFGDDGSFMGYRGIGTDITEQVESARTIRISEDQFRALMDHLPSFMNLKDVDGRYRLIYKRYSETFGLDHKSVAGKVISEFRPDEQSRDAGSQEREVVETVHAVTRERSIVVDGETKTFLVTKFPILNDEGQVHQIGTIGTDISRLKDVQFALERAKSEADHASRSKSEFLAAMSHELRTPLNAIIGFSEIITQGLMGDLPEKHKEYSSDIRRSGEHLLTLVNELLDISRIDAGKAQLFFDPTNLAHEIGESIRLLLPKMREKNLLVDTSLPPTSRPLPVDKRAFRQILLNLVSNAQKFTPDGGAVSIKLQETDSGVTVFVSDTGIGIEDTDLAVVTDLFTRGHRDPYTSDEGWGLGLAISKSLVELHGGSLEIESVVGRGTTVAFSIPNHIREG